MRAWKQYQDTARLRRAREQSLAKKRYIMEEKVDPGVIGGVALYLGNDFVIDGTIRGKLKRISKLLTNSNE